MYIYVYLFIYIDEGHTQTHIAKDEDDVGPTSGSMASAWVQEKQLRTRRAYSFLEVSMAEAEKEFRHQGLWSFLRGAQAAATNQGSRSLPETT